MLRITARMEAIEVSGIESLSVNEKNIANNLLNEYYIKIQRQLKNAVSLRLYVKEYSRLGKAKKYSMRLEAISPTKKFEASSFDWDFARTLHKILNKIMNEIEHYFHASEQHQKQRQRG